MTAPTDHKNCSTCSDLRARIEAMEAPMTAASNRASEDAAIDAAACAHIGPNGPDDAIREAGRHAFKAGAYWMRGILRAELEQSRRERDRYREALEYGAKYAGHSFAPLRAVGEACQDALAGGKEPRR